MHDNMVCFPKSGHILYFMNAELEYKLCSTCEYISIHPDCSIRGFSKYLLASPLILCQHNIFDAGLIGLSEAQKSPIAKRNDCLKCGS